MKKLACCIALRLPVHFARSRYLCPLLIVVSLIATLWGTVWKCIFLEAPLRFDNYKTTISYNTAFFLQDSAKPEKIPRTFKIDNSFETQEDDEQLITIAKIEDYDEDQILEEGTIEGQEEHLEEYFEETTMVEDEYLDENEQEIEQEDEEMDQKEMATVKVWV